MSGFRPSGVYRATLPLVALLLLLLTVLPLPTAAPSTSSSPPAPVAVSTVPSESPATDPALSLVSSYSATLHATTNTSASSVSGSTTANWTGNKTYGLSPSLALSGSRFSWNGLVDLRSHGEIAFETGASVSTFPAGYTYSIGTVQATLTVSGRSYNWSYSFNAHSSAALWVYIAPTWGAAGPSNGSMSVRLNATPATGYTWSGAIAGTYVLPLNLDIATGSGVNTATATPPTTGSVSAIYGWSWPTPTLASTTSGFAWAPSATSGSLSWSAPYKIDTVYHSTTHSGLASGTVTGVLVDASVEFKAPVGASGDVPASTYSFPVNYTVVSNVTSPYLLTYTVTVGGTTTSSTLAATSVVPYNSTYSVYVYEATTPYGSATRVTMTAESGWTYASSWPSSGTYYTGNLTVVWLAPVPNETQAAFIAPNAYTPATLTVVYVPASPVFNLFGATLPYSAVLTYVNGLFQPYATFSVNVGATYNVSTYDVFGNLLQTRNVTIDAPPAQVADISIDIWPMTVANENSSYVIGLLITENSVTQTSPDIMPLSSETFYLPAGTYTITLNYLLLSSPTIAKTVQFSLAISGVSYDVVTGLTFLNIQTTTTMVGNNISRLVQTVNATLVDANQSIAQLVTSLTNGLFSFHLGVGTPTRTQNVYDMPVFVTNGAGGAVNGTLTDEVRSDLAVTYINASGSTSATFYTSPPATGTFSLFIAPTASQVSEVENGLGVFVLTSLVHAAGTTVVAAGVVGASVLASAVVASLPSSPLNQQLLLSVANTTRNSTTGYSTSTASWTNDYNGSFGGQLVLTGSWLANAQDVAVLLDGVPVGPNEMSVTPSEILVFAGVANVSRNATLDVTVTYLNVPQASLYAAAASLGPLALTPPTVYLLISVAALSLAAAFEWLTGRRVGLTVSLLVLLLVGGGVVFY